MGRKNYKDFVALMVSGIAMVISLTSPSQFLNSYLTEMEIWLLTNPVSSETYKSALTLDEGLSNKNWFSHA